MKKLTKKSVKNMCWTCLCILAGNALLAFTVAAFIIPHDIIMGGTTGIGIVMEGIWHIETALIILILNVVLLLFGWIILGHKFFLSTVASSILYPVFLGLIQRIPGIDCLTTSPIIAAIYGGSLMGIALGMVMRVGSSTGGMDVVALVLNKWIHLPVSFFVYLTDFIVVGGQALFTTPDKILLGIIVLVIESLLIEQAMIVGKSKIQVLAVSGHYDEIRQKLLQDVSAGVTLLQIETGLLQEQQKAVMCVVSSRRLHAVTQTIHEIDPEAFLTISKIKEVHGRGFTEDRILREAKEKKEDPGS